MLRILDSIPEYELIELTMELTIAIVNPFQNPTSQSERVQMLIDQGGGQTKLIDRTPTARVQPGRNQAARMLKMADLVAPLPLLQPPPIPRFLCR